jgi:hypothetical protein
MIICCLIRVVDWSKHNRKLDYRNQMNFQAQSFFYLVSNRDLLKNFPILCSIYSNRTRDTWKTWRKFQSVFGGHLISIQISLLNTTSLRVGGSYTYLQLSRLRFFSFLSRCEYCPAVMHGDLCLFRFIIMFALWCMGEGYSQGARPNLTSTSYAPYFRNAPTLHKTHNNKKLHNVSHTEQQFANPEQMS